MVSKNEEHYEVYASSAAKRKLAEEHSISFEEVEEAFYNSSPPFPVDKRPLHRSVPPTRWFISETMEGRMLKVVFIMRKEESRFEIKSAYEPDEADIMTYLIEGGRIKWE